MIRTLRRTWKRLLGSMLRRNADDDLTEELDSHIQLLTDEHIRRGLPPEEAHRRARLQFGSVEATKEGYRDQRGLPALDTLNADARYSVRRLWAHPGYAWLAVVTLALGVGGTASVYGVARGVLFDLLPYANESEVGVFWKKTDWTHQEFLHIRGRVPGFQQVALYRQRDVIIRDGDQPARLVAGVSASAELFEVLGARPMLGRGFVAGDDVPGAERVAVLSFGLWLELGGNQSLIGSQVTVDDRPRTIIGVMPRGFWYPDPSVRIWTPEPLTPESRSWNSTLLGRVAPDQDVRAMEAPVAQLTAMLDERFDYPAQWDKTKNPHITPLRDDVLGPMRPALLATLGAMALILLIGCANVAALMLGQVDARSVELAVRSALGASRRRLTQQLIVEVMLIATAAGVLGTAFAWGGFTLVTRALPLGVWAESVAPDWRVFVSAMAIAVTAALLVILVPTVSLYRGDLRGVLSRTRTGGIGQRGGRLENVLVIAEVALAVMIAVGAALLMRSVANLYAVDPGVRVEGVAVVDVIIGDRLPRVRRQQTLDELTEALAELPGVRSAGAVQTLPLRGGGYNLPIRVEGSPAIEGITTEYRVVTPGYFESVGLALRQGRSIGDADRRDAERVVVINEALAQKYFAGADPIGRLVGGDVDPGAARVVGVVANAVERRLTDAVASVRYVAVAQMPWMDPSWSLVLHAAPGVDETSLLEQARHTVVRVAPAVAVQQTTTMRRVLDTAIGPARQVVLLLSLLTALALLLGAVGIYGVIGHFAARRRRDWAIRVALGLPGSRVITHVVGHGALLVTAGIAVGVVGAAVLTRLLSSFLYGVSAIDPVAFAVAGAALLGVGMLAAFVPAWRAGMADPVIALREQ
jgi:predicted permease